VFEAILKENISLYINRYIDTGNLLLLYTKFWSDGRRLIKILSRATIILNSKYDPCQKCSSPNKTTFTSCTSYYYTHFELSILFYIDMTMLKLKKNKYKLPLQYCEFV